MKNSGMRAGDKRSSPQIWASCMIRARAGTLQDFHLTELKNSVYWHWVLWKSCIHRIPLDGEDQDTAFKPEFPLQLPQKCLSLLQ
jgi:hypothetical protein